jgi:coenzyme PQQ biosynthesis protein PqqD
MSGSVVPTASSIPRKSERIAARAVDGKAVLVVLDARKLHTLNAVGTRVFELCDGTLTIAEIAQRLAQEFDVDPSIAERDALAFLQQLTAEGAVEVLNAGGTR